jgi:protein MBA1
MTWHLSSISRPLIVSSRAMPIPSEGTDSRKAPTAIQQVVFKIKSRQRLVIEREDLYSSGSAPSTEKLPWSPDGAHEAAVEDEVRPDVHEKRVVEYMVLQRKYWKGEMEPWKVWGFADPTTLETLRMDEEWTEKSNAWEAQANV